MVDPCCHDRLAAARKASRDGRVVIGLIGAGVPIELVISAGGFPVTLGGRAEDFGQSTAFMEPQHDAELQSLFHQAVAGEFRFCSLVIIAGTSDSHRYLFQYWTEMRRRGQQLPPVTLCDWLYGNSTALTNYNRQVLISLCSILSSVCATNALLEQLPSAILQANAFRHYFRELSTRRLEGNVLGSQFMRALSAGLADPLNPLRKSGNEPPAAGRGFESPALLLISAAPLYYPALHELVESAGGQVVDEDDEWGSRRVSADVSIEGDPLTALQAFYLMHAPSPRMPTQCREDWLRHRLRTHDLSGVIFYIPRDDSYFGWRYPALRDFVASTGAGSLLIEDNVLEGAGNGDIATSLNHFVASVAPPVHSAQ